jgi:hypothetical protein
VKNRRGLPCSGSYKLPLVGRLPLQHCRDAMMRGPLANPPASLPLPCSATRRHTLPKLPERFINPTGSSAPVSSPPPLLCPGTPPCPVPNTSLSPAGNPTEIQPGNVSVPILILHPVSLFHLYHKYFYLLPSFLC